MKLNTTTQYAIRILSCIAFEEDKRYNAKELSNKLDIPYKYLTKVMTQLVGENLVRSLRGREGGYELTQPAESIYISDILKAVKDELKERNCLLNNAPCNDEDKCILHDEWQAPKDLICSMFSQKSLKDLKNDFTT